MLDKILTSAKDNLKTIGDWVRFGCSYFGLHKLHHGHGADNAHDEAEYLVLKALHLNVHDANRYQNASLLPEEIETIVNFFHSRAIDKIPSAYITNEAILQGYSFYVDKRSIIPRSFIAQIILKDELLGYIANPDEITRVLDLCTGNGSLAVIAADYFYNSNVVASDIDTDALCVAKINVENYNLCDRISLVESNLFEQFTDSDLHSFDIIVTNPPYVDDSHMKMLTSEYLHEPQIALFGGSSGLDFVCNIIKNAGKFLTDNGILIVEMGDNALELEGMFPQLDFMWFDLDNGGVVFLLSAKQLIGVNL